MKKHWIEFGRTRLESPMTWFVHGTTDERDQPVGFPPLDKAVPGKGFARYRVQYGDFVFRFSSLAEVRECVDVLGRRVLPSPKRFHLNGHWLARLPLSLLGWRHREKMVAYLKAALGDFEKDVGRR